MSKQQESSQRLRVIGIACLLGAVAVALIAFGIINLWPYDTGASYQPYVSGRPVGGTRSGASIVSQNNSAASVLIVPLLVIGVSLLRMSRSDVEERDAESNIWLAAAIVGAVGALVAYAGFFAQFVEQGDLWLGNPLVVMWLSAIIMLAVYGLMKADFATLRQRQIGGLVIVGLLTAFLLAFMTWGVIDGFFPLWLAIALSLLTVGMTVAVGVVVARGPRGH